MRARTRSGRQLLAAAGATGGDDLAAADSGHAGAETVTALAHELGGLIGPLHRNSPKIAWAPNRGAKQAPDVGAAEIVAGL